MHFAAWCGYDWVVILDRIREATRAQHQALEEALPLGQESLDRVLYGRLLARFWGFYATWEQQAALHAGIELRPVLASRAKLPLLNADLKAMALNSEVLPRIAPDRLPRFASGEGTLLGSMYVVEGATLGGQVISRQLERFSGFERGAGYSFFQSYGKAVGQQWRAFTQLLEALPPREAEPAVAAAQQTFSAFAEWFAEGGFGGHPAP